MSPRVAVIVFPGSNDDRDAALALERLGAEAVLVWHAEEELPAVGAVVLPGGFSYGDYLRCGAIARFAPVMASVEAFARDGGPVLGICNGFQILCEAGLLPGVAAAEHGGGAFVCRDIVVTVTRTDTPLTRGCSEGQRLVSRSSTARAATCPRRGLPEEQVVLRYGHGENPNGAVDDIAGVVSERGNVMGLMPHPEHAVDPLLGSTDGALILGSLIDAARVVSVPA